MPSGLLPTLVSLPPQGAIVVVALLAYSNGSTGLSVIGILMAAIGVVLMVLKIVRRNQGSQF